MNTELRKKLEEAADGIYPVLEIYNDLDMEFVDVNGGLREAFQDGGEVGAECGYKEAIKVAKEWLAVKGVFSGETCGDLKQYIIDFEAYMNKLWEEKK